ncbi:MAG: hypothetical protein JWM21_904 [Acidobacteria bacterium]|nr:hypothetical protein [Acidobacteriota bacterium]
MTIMALALIARKGSAESCNCKLTRVADTDNHIVLVDNAALRKPTLAAREEDSETAEFTPRVRLTHPDLSRGQSSAPDCRRAEAGSLSADHWALDVRF